MKSKGVTLIELMIALAINALLFIAIVSVFYNNLTHYNRVLKSDRLNQQLQGAIQLMSREIRRAGYWGNGNSLIGAAQNTNPFMSTANGTDLNVTASCVLFTYDKNGDGSLPSISAGYDDERYGFRLSNQTLQSRPPGATFACNASNWENITDPNVVLITALNFTLTTTTVTSGTITLLMRSVDITLTGRLANDATITKTVTQHIRILNDKFTPP